MDLKMKEDKRMAEGQSKQTAKDDEELKGVGLYKAIRVFNDLKQLAREEKQKQQKENGAEQQHEDEDDVTFPLEHVWAHDQLHYDGTKALDRAVNTLGLVEGQHVLDVGAGLGGPARYLTHTKGLRVVGVELQKDMCDAACKITSHTELRDDERLHFVQGDFIHMPAERLLKYTEDEAGFECVMSILTLLHIDAKDEVLAKCFQLLRPGGCIYLEDYFEAGEMSDATKKALKEEVGCAMPLPSRSRYIELLQQAGFVNISFDDCTSLWADFVKDRAQAYEAKLDHHKQVQGDEGQVHALNHFYQTVAALFEPKNKSGLGGVLLSAQRPHA